MLQFKPAGLGVAGIGRVSAARARGRGYWSAAPILAVVLCRALAPVTLIATTLRARARARPELGQQWSSAAARSFASEGW